MLFSWIFTGIIYKNILRLPLRSFLWDKQRKSQVSYVPTLHPVNRQLTLPLGSAQKKNFLSCFMMMQLFEEPEMSVSVFFLGQKKLNHIWHSALDGWWKWSTENLECMIEGMYDSVFSVLLVFPSKSLPLLNQERGSK